MTNQIQSVSFHNQQITVLNHNNKPYVAMKSIVENIGLDWTAQLKRIKRHHVLSKGMVIMTTPSKGGVQEYVCLPISMLNGWLFGIDTNRVKPEIRPVLEQYQLECFDVLYNHFMPKVANQYPNTITSEQQQAIRQAVNERVFRFGQTHQAIYGQLYEMFKIPKYQDLPISKFDEAMQWLNATAIVAKGQETKLPARNPSDLFYIEPEYQVTLNKQEISCVNALFECLDYIVETFYPKVKEMIPDLNKEFDGEFKSIRILKFGMKAKYNEIRELGRDIECKLR